MKRIAFIASFLLLACMAMAQTITITPTALEVVGSGAASRAFYDLDNVFIIYRASTAKVQVKELMSNNELFDGDTSEVTISGLTLWSDKETKLATWMQDATTTTGYRYFMPNRGLNYVWKNGSSTLQAVDGTTKRLIWSGTADSLKNTGVTGASNILAFLRTKKFLDAFRDHIDLGETATIAAGAAAGTSPTIAITSRGTSGKITLTTGASGATTTGVLCTVTLPVTYPTGTFVTVTPANTNAAIHVARWFVSGSTATFTLNASGTALGDATQYIWNYSVTGY